MKIHVNITAMPRRLDDGTMELTAQMISTGQGSKSGTLPATAAYTGDEDAATLMASIQAAATTEAVLLGFDVTENDVMIWAGPQQLNRA